MVGGDPYMPKHGTHTNKNKVLEGGRYARTERELRKKAIALLEKCQVEDRPTLGRRKRKERGDEREAA
jgi:hypothetical protein